MPTQTLVEMVTEFHNVYGLPIRTTPTLDIPERKLRVELVREEVKEYTEAEETNDFIEVVDAQADILYVVAGAAIAHGDTEYNNFFEEYNSTLTKATTPTLAISGRKSLVEAVNVEFKAYEAAEEADDLEAIFAAFRNITKAVANAGAEHGVDLKKVLEEVQRSNLSKLHHETGLPIRREDGKILKGQNFSAPDINSVLIAQNWVA